MTEAKKLEHELNHMADILAGQFRKLPKPSFVPQCKPLLSPFLEAENLYDKSAITSKLLELTNYYELYYR